MKFISANRIAASHLGLFCLPKSNNKEPILYGLSCRYWLWSKNDDGGLHYLASDKDTNRPGPGH